MSRAAQSPCPFGPCTWACCVVYPLLVYPEEVLFRWTEISIGMQLTYIFIYAILALGLNVVVGYTGILHLGIAAFFGIGAYITGILTVPAYPFRVRISDDAGAVDRRRGAGWACCSARRRCGCAATTWPSSRWASAR